MTVASHLPASFQGNGFLYAAALASLMSIACLSIAVCGWMIRDTYRDRYYVHPKSLVFIFRLIFMIIGFTAFIRCFPEVIYLQVYGDNTVNPELVAIVLTWKRLADSISLGFFATWLSLFVAVYPHVIIALKRNNSAVVMQVDIVSVWPRLLRPTLLFFLIVAVACLTAYAKVYGAR